MKRPLIVSNPPPEFGELEMEPGLLDHAGMKRDYSYVPGFSDLRVARDKAILEVLRGERDAKEVPTLPYNLRWARCETRKGEPDTRKVVSAENRGYRAVTQNDVGEGKLIPKLPAGSKFAADGTLKQGDVILMITDAKTAGRNEFAKRARTESAIRGAEEGFETALKQSGVQPSRGASPYIQKEVGRPTRAELTPKPK